jgi:ribonuclease HII
MSETMETHEHAEHAAESGRRGSALLIAVVAACLAFAEQGAQHAQTDLSAHAIAATDLWAEYQAKSIRANQSQGLASIASVLAPAGPDRDALVAKLKAEADHFDADKTTGKPAIAAHARAEEDARNNAHEKLEAYENAAALLQLAIVLITASVIAQSRLLLTFGFLVGVVGAGVGLIGLIRPGLLIW